MNKVMHTINSVPPSPSSVLIDSSNSFDLLLEAGRIGEIKGDFSDADEGL